mmetsp:Transcript_94166/g.269926  ORF Transcript_94166/g.269926 Transcript_94166/m.269926 type:complete len:296 (-) Transcript_94166:602-1489(-)|eukprot:CAMPEP_0177199510 /NCGR_PEP_ID=MMETSP0367-20130122/25714_1 /TAXON_ID=447022 ORGANISM="Scrippsiella hangoei-like, Strain SHHI-4" /NCGR_SAMPLE_ID=MMETSP0367 /ASSEMBLY_ACC=CAM_ASM_000362 /LENGTH=295 /DNA_ID=CAMNT_0018647867 /DNA_START=1 /DNA_END=888 /DNA_ORIENTATION=+
MATMFLSTSPPSAEQAGALAAPMPPLAGKPLEVPSFHETGWEDGQKFSTEDDPDRTTLPWERLAFVDAQDPASARSGTTVEDLHLGVPSAWAKVVRNVLSEETCAELLARVNSKGYTPALINCGRFQRLMPFVRNGHRVVVDCPELATWLFEVLRPHLPDRLEDGSEIVGLNERLRFLCYTPGQFFEEHFDGKYTRPAGQPGAGEHSAITVQLYLHDVPTECGGATSFCLDRYDTSKNIGHQPEAGSVLLFTQNLPHEGQLVKSGLKYTLRTEVMYTPRPAKFSIAGVKQLFGAS